MQNDIRNVTVKFTCHECVHCQRVYIFSSVDSNAIGGDGVHCNVPNHSWDDRVR